MNQKLIYMLLIYMLLRSVGVKIYTVHTRSEESHPIVLPVVL